ncbi:MAG: NYN domain-containing protein [Roseiflexaceae bacterium]|nr:NYN domain-containing protein [Roseiflexaceae bacterium]
MSNDNRRPDDVAVFIDFENIYVSVRDKLDANPNFEMIMDRCEDYGRVVIARAYADWYRYPRVTSALYANGVEPMYVPTYYYDRDMGRTGRAIKNSVDMNLCIDAMKTLFTNPNIGKFVLCTGDRDFIPLVNSIRQQGKDVIIIGIGGAASSHLAQSADEFIFYETLIGKRPSELLADQPKAKMPEKGREYEFENPGAPPPIRETPIREVAPVRTPEPIHAPELIRASEPIRAPEPTPATPQVDIFDVLVQAVHVARERDFVCSFGSLKLLMKELMGGEFREDKYRDASGRPFAKFKDFVMEAERRGKVQVFTSGAMNEVFLPGEDPYKLSRFAMDLKEEPRAPVSPAPLVEDRPEQRQTVGGRRRRRRSRGGRSQGAGQGAQNGEGLDELEELEELELAFVEGDEAADGSDAMFDELLDRLDEEETRREVLEGYDALQLLDTVGTEEAVQPAELLEFEAPILDEPIQLEELEAEATADQLTALEAEPAVFEIEPGVAELLPSEPIAPSAEVAAVGAFETDNEEQPAISLPFTDEEWTLLLNLMARTDKALSFVQIHDLLRDARNNAGISRTNEELRSLIKQAINAGKLVRSGKGTRVNYRLAPPEMVTTEPTPIELEATSEAEPVAVIESEAPAEPVVETEPAVLVVEPVAVVQEEPKTTKPSRSRRKKADVVPDVAVAVVKAAPEPEPVVVVEEPATKPSRSRRKKKPADAEQDG